MGTEIERTALHDFKYAGARVKAGQVVTITGGKRKLMEMVTAGLVEETDEANASVPKLVLPDAAMAVDDAARQAAEAGNAAHTGGGSLRQTGGLVDALVTGDAAGQAAAEAKRQDGIRQQATLDAAAKKQAFENAQKDLGAAKVAAKKATDNVATVNASTASDAAAKTKAQADAADAQTAVDKAQAALDALTKV